MKRNILYGIGMLLLVMLTVTACSPDVLSNFSKVHTYEAGQFADVAEDAWYWEDVASVYELGLVNGVSDDAFAPDGNVTVAEAVAIAARLHSIYVDDGEDFAADGGMLEGNGEDLTADGGMLEGNGEDLTADGGMLWGNGEDLTADGGMLEGNGEDLTADGEKLEEGSEEMVVENSKLPMDNNAPDDTGSSWYQVYVDYAIKEGIITEDQFEDYSVAAMRSEFASIFAAALPESELKAINSIEVGSIYDVEPDESYSEAVYRLYNAGVITGSDSYGTFNPKSNIKRSEVSTIINRMVYPPERVSFTPEEPDPVTLEVYNIIDNMTIKQKIHQLFIVTPEALTGSRSVTRVDEKTKNSLEQFPVGGIIYFADNLINPEQTKKMLAETMEYGYELQGMPLFLCVDEEGGRVARVAGNSAFNVAEVGAMQDIDDVNEAYKTGRVIGDYLSELGFNLDFAPVTDVLTVEGNVNIGDRSFGSDPVRVTEMASALSDGLHEYNIMSTFKHFPGNGAAAGDTHEGFVYTDKTLEQLYEAELIPFMAAEEKGVDAVMVGHISVPEITGDDTPSSLSEYMVTDVLRGQLGFSGLIITDSLEMGAVTETYGADQAAVMALKAGNDILLMPEDLQGAVEGIFDAVEKGEIAEGRIEESLKRIVKAKFLMKEQNLAEE